MLSKEQIAYIVEEYANMPTTRGVLLAGSYAWGVPTEQSDLDLQVVSRGLILPDRNLIKFGVTLDIYKMRVENIRANLRSNAEWGNGIYVHLWSHGVVVFDPEGVVSQLKQQAVDIWNRGHPRGLRWADPSQRGAKTLG
jgi:hypothetical protein